MVLSVAEIFIDTGAFIARFDADDQYHAQAAEHWRRLAGPVRRIRLFTSGPVLGETLTLLGHRAGFPLATRVAELLLGSNQFTILYPDAVVDQDASRLFATFADQALSWVDCQSFALMRRERLRHAFTFDRHFADAGFLVWNR